jgi:hypothetical protein
MSFAEAPLTTFPNFFIVGAPKSGTTALYEYLRQHPEIFMPAIKEPHFFGSDLHSEKFIRDEAAYRKIFQLRGTAPLAGEASVYYLYSREAAAEISRFNPASKIIIMLRNPVEMIHSLHSQAVSSANEDILDFAEALNAEAHRHRGDRIPDIADFPQGLFYRDIGHYAEQVDRFLRCFSAEQVRIILFDEFVRTPEKIYQEVLRFLEVQDMHFEPEFRKVNENRRLVSVTLEHFFKRQTGIRRTLKTATPRLYSSLYAAFRRLNARKARRAPMDARLRAALLEEFAPEISVLAKLIGRDLSHWST